MIVAPKDPEKLLKEEGSDWLTPDVHPAIIADINCSQELARHKEELVRGARAQYHLGILRQRQRKAVNDQIERAYVEGLGRQVASFDPEVFARLELVQGRGWWRDRKELMAFLRDNPMFAIRTNAGFTNGRSFSVRVNGLRNAKAEKLKPETLKGAGEHRQDADATSRRLELSTLNSQLSTCPA